MTVSTTSELGTFHFFQFLLILLLILTFPTKMPRTGKKGQGRPIKTFHGSKEFFFAESRLKDWMAALDCRPTRF